jgi:hypothetical protein
MGPFGSFPRLTKQWFSNVSASCTYLELHKPLMHIASPEVEELIGVGYSLVFKTQGKSGDSDVQTSL